MTDEEVAKTHHCMALQGKHRSAVRWLTERMKGGALDPENNCSKTGDPVSEVLKSKHPEPQIPNVEDFYDHAYLPEIMELDITQEHVEQVARHASGATGPGGTDSTAIQNWLLQHGKTSTLLRKSFANLVSWLANTDPPWNLRENGQNEKKL